MQTQDEFISGYVNMENVSCCLNVYVRNQTAFNRAFEIIIILLGQIRVDCLQDILSVSLTISISSKHPDKPVSLSAHYKQPKNSARKKDISQDLSRGKMVSLPYKALVPFVTSPL